MNKKDVTLLMTSLGLMVAYFISLLILIIHWNPVMATVLILLGTLCWGGIGYGLLERLIRHA